MGEGIMGEGWTHIGYRYVKRNVGAILIDISRSEESPADESRGIEVYAFTNEGDTPYSNLIFAGSLAELIAVLERFDEQNKPEAMSELRQIESDLDDILQRMRAQTAQEG